MAESNLDSAARSPVGARGIMQLMPSTFAEIQSRNPQITRIDDPGWNIAAGIYYDRVLWRLWQQDSVEAHRREFMFGSYNAGRTTIRNAQGVARAAKLDPRQWPSIEAVGPRVPRWKHRETVSYVRRIQEYLARFDDKGRLRR